MEESQDVKTFCEKNRISAEDWRKSGCDWDELCKIAVDYLRNQELLRETAEAFARIVQKFEGVHSVRLRVKDVDHLLEKIVRKKCEGSEKYENISVDNYKDIITDIVGIRALHLFKDDCFLIDAQIRETWLPQEMPKAYFREGDHESLRDKFKEKKFDVENHKAGYRSVHYVVSSNLTQQKISVEIQVRTIFEEGWSEIDHRVRYPNFSSDPQIDIFLAIFNRTAGSADEMGTFARELAKELTRREAVAKDIESERDGVVQKMEDLLSQIANSTKLNEKQSSEISNLNRQLDELKRNVAESNKRKLEMSSESAKIFQKLIGMSELNSRVQMSPVDAAGIKFGSDPALQSTTESKPLDSQSAIDWWKLATEGEVRNAGIKRRTKK